MALAPKYLAPTGTLVATLITSKSKDRGRYWWIADLVGIWYGWTSPNIVCWKKVLECIYSTTWTWTERIWMRRMITTMAGLTGISTGYLIVDMHAKTHAHRHRQTTKQTMYNHTSQNNWTTFVWLTCCSFLWEFTVNIMFFCTKVTFECWRLSILFAYKGGGRYFYWAKTRNNNVTKIKVQFAFLHLWIS